MDRIGMEADVRGDGTRRPGRSAEGRNIANGAAPSLGSTEMAHSGALTTPWPGR